MYRAGEGSGNVGAVESIRTPEKRVAFLAVLAETGIVAKALEGCGIGRSAAYAWRREDPDFAEEWDRALQVGITALEDEVHRRGFLGDEQPVYGKDGNVTGVQRKYSDTLAIFLLKAHHPDKYRERTELKHAGSIAFGTMTDEEINREIAALAARQADDPAADLV